RVAGTIVEPELQQHAMRAFELARRHDDVVVDHRARSSSPIPRLGKRETLEQQPRDSGLGKRPRHPRQVVFEVKVVRQTERQGSGHDQPTRASRMGSSLPSRLANAGSPSKKAPATVTSWTLTSSRLRKESS